MRILWTTNLTLPVAASAIGLPVENKEGWLSSLATVLSKDTGVNLGIVSFETDIKKFVDVELAGIRFFVIPRSRMKINSEKAKIIYHIKKNFNPDIIHINGTEYSDALILLRELSIPGVVSIQGLTHVISRYVFTGFDMKYLLAHPLFAVWLLRNQLAYERKGRTEIQYLTSVKNIIGRTDWDNIHARIISPQAKYYVCNENLRSGFYENRWNIEAIERHSIYISQGNYQIKGAHIIIKMLGKLRERYPDVRVVFGGQNPLKKKNGLLGTVLSSFDYGHFIKNELIKYKVEDIVHFEGPLGESQVINELLKSHITIVPSTIENSPNSLGEAMIMGVPCVASYVGGIPYLTDNGNSSLLYRCEEWEMLYNHICRLFDDDEFALCLSERERQKASVTHNREMNTLQMINIYKSIIGEQNV